MPVPLAPPLAERRFRHPGTGAEALLRVDTVPQPGGEPAWYAVRLMRPDGEGAVPGVMYMTEVKDRSWARRLWAERERELRAAGYVRA
jgi:hypothetical protein